MLTAELYSSGTMIQIAQVSPYLHTEPDIRGP